MADGFLGALIAAVVACAVIAPVANAQAPCQVFDGTVAGAPAELCLVVDGTGVSGSYHYFKYQSPIALSGTFNKDTQSIELTETPTGQAGGAITGKWAGSFDPQVGVLSGTFSNGDKGKPFFFYDARRDPVRTQRQTLRAYSDCDDEGNVMTYSFTWDHVIAANPEVADAINGRIEAALKGWREHPSAIRSSHPTLFPSHPKCNQPDRREYNEGASYIVSSLGKFLVALERGFGGYSGGAHGYESGAVTYFDLRTGKEVPFLDFFTERGRTLMMDRVLTDLTKEKIAGPDSSPQIKCKIDLSAIWGFGAERSSYIPWRLEGKENRPKPSPDDLNYWNVSYGTYAFGCTGRPGYEMYDLPPEVVSHELNPIYFDPQTRFFYK